MKTPLDTFSTTHKSWVEPFIMELRLANVPGTAIGDALETVHAHCADSGESPHEAFGDPKEYAQSLGLQGQPDSDLLPIVISSVVNLSAFFVFSAAVRAWANNQNFALNIVSFIAVAGFLISAIAAILALRWWAEKPLRYLLFVLPVAGFSILGAFATTMNLPALLELPTLTVVMTAAAILLISALVSTVRELRTPDSDPLVSPLDSPQTVQGKTRSAHLAMLTAVWIFPVIAALDAVLTLVILG